VEEESHPPLLTCGVNDKIASVVVATHELVRLSGSLVDAYPGRHLLTVGVITPNQISVPIDVVGFAPPNEDGYLRGDPWRYSKLQRPQKMTTLVDAAGSYSN
jgi:hypothetical protein